MKGFLNKSHKAGLSRPVEPTLRPNERMLTTQQIMDLCHHTHTLIRTDVSYLEDLEKRIRQGTNTEYLSGKYKSEKGGGCCGDVDHEHDKNDDTERMIQQVIQAEEAKKKGLPGSNGPTKSQLDDLVENFKPREQTCCRRIQFRYVENDPVGTVLEHWIGQIDENMIEVIIEAMKIAQSSHSNVVKGIEKDRQEQLKTAKDTDTKEEQDVPNEFIEKLGKSDHPMLNDFKAMLNPDKTPIRAPVRGTAEDRFSRQMVFKEALIRVLKQKVTAELTRRNKVDSKVGGMVATPGGWTLGPLDYLSQDVLSTLFSSKTEDGVVACLVPGFMNVSEPNLDGVLACVARMDSDAVLRPMGSTTRVRKCWMGVDGFKQSEFPMLTHFLFQFGSIPFEINKKCGFHLQIPSDFLFERTYLHPPAANHHEDQIPEEVLKPRPRLECGVTPEMDNGRVLGAIYCIEEPKFQSSVFLSQHGADWSEVKYPLKKGQLIIFKTRNTITRFEHSGNEGQNGNSTTVTLFLKGILN